MFNLRPLRRSQPDRHKIRCPAHTRRKWSEVAPATEILSRFSCFSCTYTGVKRSNKAPQILTAANGLFMKDSLDPSMALRLLFYLRPIPIRLIRYDFPAGRSLH